MNSKSNPSKKEETNAAVNAQSDDSESVNPRMIPTPNELISLLSKRVIGQDQAKQSIAVAVYQHFINCARSDLLGGRVEPDNNVILLGPTGCGKSQLLRSLGEILEVPMFTIPCTNITPNGYKGRDLVQHLDSVAEIIVTDGFTQPSIVVWDECDKLSIYGHGEADFAASANVYRRMTQMDFLVYLDGAKCGSDGELDSSRILNIAIGAFNGMDLIRNPRAKPVVGFHQAGVSTRTTLLPVAPEHLITYGLIPEFVGRFSRLATLDPLDHGTMRRIITEAEGNVMARRKEFFALHGVRLEITDDAIDALVSSAVAQGTGARALRLVIDRMLRGVEHRLPEMAASGVNALIYDRDAVLGLSAPIEHSGKPAHPAQLFKIRRRAACVLRKASHDRRGDDLGIF